MRFSTIASSLIVLALAGGTALQASVIYEFTGTTVNTDPQAFQLTVPDFLNPAPGSPLIFACGDLTAATNCDGNVEFSSFVGGTAIDQITIDFGGSAYPYQFDVGTFSVLGVHASDVGNGDTGTLTVTQTETPEPATLLGMLGGLSLLGLYRARAHAGGGKAR